MDVAATTPSQIPSFRRSPRLSSRVAGSKHPTIKECDLPPSKVLKTSGFVASLQKVAKESGDLEEELDFTLCTNITRSDQVLIITCKRLGYHECSKAASSSLSSYKTSLSLQLRHSIVSFYTSVTSPHALVALCTALWSSTVLFTIFSTQVLFAGLCYKCDTLPLLLYTLDIMYVYFCSIT